MASKVKTKKTTATAKKTGAKAAKKIPRTNGKPVVTRSRANAESVEGNGRGASAGKAMRLERRASLHRMLTSKRQEIMKAIGESLGQSLTVDQQRRLESAMDVGDMALMDLERELGISLLEMRNRKRQLIDEALMRLEEGTYGACAECGVEISEKRLAAVPFAKLCVACQAKQELLEKIEKGEERE